MVVAVLTAEDTHPARGADGMLCIAAGKAHPFAGQPIDVGGEGLRMAFHSNTCCLMLIGNDVEHVQRFAFRFIRMRRSFDCTRHKRGSSCLQKLATIELCAHFFSSLERRPVKR